MTFGTRRVTLPLPRTDGNAPARPTSAPTSVTAVVHEPDTPGPEPATDLREPDALGSGPEETSVPVLLFPGAGGSLESEPLVTLAEVVAAAGHRVVRANLPHHERGAPAPRASTSSPTVGAILAAARAELGVGAHRLWVLGGRSYGSRVVSMAIADGLPAAGLLCSGYPLHPPGRPDELRVAHWPRIAVPVLFVHGDADPMAEPALLDQRRLTLAGGSRLAVVRGGDHALKVTRARSPDGRARSPAASTRGVADEVASWLRGLGTPRGDPARTGRGPDG